MIQTFPGIRQGENIFVLTTLKKKVLATLALNSCSFPSLPFPPILLFWNKDLKFGRGVIFVF